MSDHSIQCVILCGGSGTRLWPLSRETMPKQFLTLSGQSSMLQRTVGRLDSVRLRLQMAPEPIVVCNAEHRFIAAQQLAEAGCIRPTMLLEPMGRNTAPALTLAALQFAGQKQDPVLLVMPADHVIADEHAFAQAVEQAHGQAVQDVMLTFGIVPTHAETGYGYIQQGPFVDNGVHAVRAFFEKPTQEKATAYLHSGEFLWNSGIFMVRASVWLKALSRCRPDILDACTTALQAGARDADFIRPDAATFAKCPSDSIDYAVMERLPGNPDLGVSAGVVAMQAGWSDLGAWDAVWENREHDAAGNALTGDALLLDSSNTLVHASDRLVAGVGLHDLVVIETADAVLVANRHVTQNVKQIVTHLKEEGRTLADTHRKVHRPWGWYDSIDAGDRFQVKRIVVKPGASLSLQMHHHRAEHWIVVRGTAEVTNGDKVMLLSENESTYIPLGHVHRLANPGKVPLEIIEVQSGSYLGEDDIVRFEDTYGRAPATNQGN